MKKIPYLLYQGHARLFTCSLHFATTFTGIEFPVYFMNDTKLDIMLCGKR